MMRSVEQRRGGAKVLWYSHSGQAKPLAPFAASVGVTATPPLAFPIQLPSLAIWGGSKLVIRPSLDFGRGVVGTIVKICVMETM